MKYDVTRYGPGGIEVITVDAESGDDAAIQAFKPGTIIRGIVPSEVVEEAVAEEAKPKRGRPAAQGEDA